MAHWKGIEDETGPSESGWKETRLEGTEQRCLSWVVTHTMSGHLQGLITARHTHRLVLFQPLLYCPFILPWPCPSSVEIKDTSNGPTMNRNADCTQSFVSLITWELWLCEDTSLCVHVIFVTNHFLRTFGSLWWVSKKACITELTVASCTCSGSTDFFLCFLL